jgi:hypothetical protein
LEFTLKLKLGEDGAKDYAALSKELIGVAHRIAIISNAPLKRGQKARPFELITGAILKVNPDDASHILIGEWKIAQEEKLSSRLLKSFPWLAPDNDESVSGADTVDELQQFYDHLVAEGN